MDKYGYIVIGFYEYISDFIDIFGFYKYIKNIYRYFDKNIDKIKIYKNTLKKTFKNDKINKNIYIKIIL